jgi:hypothetical protein
VYSTSRRDPRDVAERRRAAFRLTLLLGASAVVIGVTTGQQRDVLIGVLSIGTALLVAQRSRMGRFALTGRRFTLRYAPAAGRRIRATTVRVTSRLSRWAYRTRARVGDLMQSQPRHTAR